MTALNKQALRGQSVEGSFYLAECGHCGEMYPSNKLDGGEPLFSGDYGECFCHLCGADDSDIADNGAWGSEVVTAWNYQQKRIEALLDELEAAEKRIAELSASHSKLRDTMAGIHNTIRTDGSYTPLAAILNAAKRAHEESATAAGIGVKGE
ncbi:ead/Ea22-like family protein [Citrobacter freundii]|uniref:ead/Ea22-like family protein n=1 Tax=Citrobacter freundii TaxID=546 RepID=UPI0015EA8306|nr:ead/Ea22-like family protein [Citrobacter freundii]QLY60201.1 ead/Ea22-like family protein [Citrobacter freundii]